MSAYQSLGLIGMAITFVVCVALFQWIAGWISNAISVRQINAAMKQHNVKQENTERFLEIIDLVHKQNPHLETMVLIATYVVGFWGVPHLLAWVMR